MICGHGVAAITPLNWQLGDLSSISEPYAASPCHMTICYIPVNVNKEVYM